MILVHEPKEFKERYNWSCLSFCVVASLGRRL